MIAIMADPLTAIAEYKKKIAYLEKQLAKDNRKLLALPAKLGYKDVGELINALQIAAGISVSPTKSTSKSKRTRAKITPEIKAKVKALVKDGKTGKQIASLLGISVPSVQNIKKELGLVQATNAKKRKAQRNSK